jgi:hypothetical protein
VGSAGSLVAAIPKSKKKSIKKWEGFIQEKKSGREKKGKWRCSKKWKQNFVSKNRFH